MLNLTCTMISSIDMARYGISLVSGDCGTKSGPGGISVIHNKQINSNFFFLFIFAKHTFFFSNKNFRAVFRFVW